jgi:hypothetical protein
MQPHKFIEGYEEVIARFGQWPSFHDGEVHRIVLDRMSRSPAGSYIPSVEIHLRGWIMGPEVTAEGFYRFSNDSVVHFLFEDIFDLELEGFNQQNVLSSLNLSLIEEQNRNRQALHVELEHCYLFSGGFSARKAKVLGVVPYIESSDG